MKDLRERIKIVKRIFPKGDTALIAALHEVQDYYGWLHPEGIKLISDVLGYSQAKIESVASFYHMFRKEPHEYFIEICTNLTCMQEGAYKLLEMLKKSQREGVKVEEVECIGLCDSAPAALINGYPIKNLNESSLMEILQNLERFAERQSESYADLKSLYDKEGSDSQ